MTASNTDSLDSDNSTVRSELGGGIIPPGRDPRCRRIVDFATNQGGSATLRDLAIESGWPRSEIEGYVRRLLMAGYVHLINHNEDMIVLVTASGEKLAEEGL